jgi:hypothetical protein
MTIRVYNEAGIMPTSKNPILNRNYLWYNGLHIIKPHYG